MTGPGSGSRRPGGGGGVSVRHRRLGRGDAAVPCGSRPGPGTRAGPAFVYRPCHWASAARPPPRLLAAARPSEPGEVGARCQVTPPPPASWRDAEGKGRPGSAFPPVPAAHGAPGPRAWRLRSRATVPPRDGRGGRRGTPEPRSSPSQGQFLSASPICPGRAEAEPSLPSLCAGRAGRTLANPCVAPWYPRARGACGASLSQSGRRAGYPRLLT